MDMSQRRFTSFPFLHSGYNPQEQRETDKENNDFDIKRGTANYAILFFDCTGIVGSKKTNLSHQGHHGIPKIKKN